MKYASYIGLISIVLLSVGIFDSLALSWHQQPVEVSDATQVCEDAGTGK